MTAAGSFEAHTVAVGDDQEVVGLALRAGTRSDLDMTDAPVVLALCLAHRPTDRDTVPPAAFPLGLDTVHAGLLTIVTLLALRRRLVMAPVLRHVVGVADPLAIARDDTISDYSRSID